MPFLVIALVGLWLYLSHRFRKPDAAFRHPHRGDLTFAVCTHPDGTDYGVAYVGRYRILGRSHYRPEDPADPASPIIKTWSVDYREWDRGPYNRHGWMDAPDPGQTIGHFEAMARFPKLIEAVEDDGYALTE